jgi:molybdate transport system substrate-binding protein
MILNVGFFRWSSLCVLGLASCAATAQTAAGSPGMPPGLIVHAAGSLRAAMTDLARAFDQTQAGRSSTRLNFGASGLLKERIEGGELSNVFASANMNHPQALQTAGKAEQVLPFARNALCVLASPGFSLQGKPLAQRLLDADVRVGISTPKADPAGDYAFEMFERIESTGNAPAGSAQALKAKALQLTGGPNSLPPPEGRNVYGVVMAQGQADAFVTYCTNVAIAMREVPQLQRLTVPDAINVSAQYGLATIKPVSAEAQRFVEFVRGPQGQALLARHGFSPP